jgi:hypothetical protein
MSTTITPTEQNIDINVTNDVIDVNVTNNIVDVNATTQQIDINVAGAYPLPNAILSVFGRVGNVVATEGDYTLTQLGDVTLTSPTNGQVLKYNGTTWVNGTDAGGITSIATTSPITGGTITSTGTIGITQATTSTDGFLSSTDWNTFNNKQNTITNPVTGTGTANTIPLWNASSNITNSVITQVSGNIRVGSTTQTSKLNVGGDIDLSGVLKNNGTQIINVGSGSLALGDGTGKLTTSDVIVNTTAFTVAIGSSFAPYAFTNFGSITGNSFIRSGGTSTQFLKADGSVDSTSYQPTLTNPITGTGTSGQVAYFNGTSSITGESNLFWDATNDRLGIGISSPTTTLDVNGLTRIKTLASSFNNVLLVENTGSAAQANKNVATFIGARGNASNIDDNTNISIWQKDTTVNNYGVLSFFNGIGNLSSYIASQYLSHGAGQSANFLIGTANSGTVSTKFQIYSTGNTVIQNGGTFTDAGFRLDVNGTARVQNDATFSRIANFICPTITGGTTTFQVTSNGISFITVQENNRLTLGSAGTEIRIQGGQSINIGFSGLTFNAGNWVPSGATNLCNYIGNWTNVGSAGPNFGNVINLAVGTSHTATISTLNQLAITNTINNTGGTSTNRGIFYNPTLTSLTGTTHIAIQTVSGDVLLGTTSGNVAIGTSTLGTATELTLGGSQTASSAIARGQLLNTTLVAAANSDVLVGLDINPTFTNGAFTGVSNYWLRLNATTTNPELNLSATTGSPIISMFNNSTYFRYVASLGVSYFQVGTSNTSDSKGDLRFTSIGGVTTFLQIKGSTGNIGINTTTDAGFRLDVNGTARVQGQLTTTADAVINTVKIGLGGSSVATNIGIGFNALLNNSSGSNNVALGYQALQTNSSGSINTAVGNFSLFGNNTGSNNSMNGTSTFYANTTGSNNVGFGYNAGRYIADGTTGASVINNSILIGYNTKVLANSQTNQIVIGYDVTGLGSNTTVLGNSSTVTTAIYGDILIGTTTALASTKLTVSGSETASGAIASGQLLNTTLVAAANNDVLVGLDINPTFTLGAFTGTTTLAIRTSGIIASNNGGLYGAFVANSNRQANSSYNYSFVSHAPNAGVANQIYAGTRPATTATSAVIHYVGTDTQVYWDTTNAPYNFLISGTQYLKLFNSTGNLTLQNGGTFTDAGFRLDVNGTARIVNTLTVGSNGVAAGRIELSRAAASAAGYLYMSGNSMIIENAASVIELRPASLSSVFSVNTNGNTILSSTGALTDVASSILTINSTTKGVLFPRMTTTQKNAISSPAAGLVVYDTTLNKLSVYTGAAWETVTSL